MPSFQQRLPHWGRVTHICVSKLIIIGSDNGLSPGRRRAIIWTNAEIWSMGPLGTNFSEILIEIHEFSFKKMHLKMLSAKWRLFGLGLNVLHDKWKLHFFLNFLSNCCLSVWYVCQPVHMSALVFVLQNNIFTNDSIGTKEMYVFDIIDTAKHSFTTQMWRNIRCKINSGFDKEQCCFQYSRANGRGQTKSTIKFGIPRLSTCMIWGISPKTFFYLMRSLLKNVLHFDQLLSN